MIEQVRCVRCSGAKKMYKIGGGYSHTNMGGVHVTCPLCNGNGTTKPLHVSIAEIKDNDSKKEKPKRKSRAKAKEKATATKEDKTAD